MDFNRRLEIKKAIAKKDNVKIEEITKEELLIYIEDTQSIILSNCQSLIGNV